MLYLTLRQLEYVVGVAEAGSLTVAARQLNVSQPALSVALTQVETHLGQRLFNRRQGASISPTTFGRLFLADAATLLADAARLEDPRAFGSRRVGQVTIGFFEDLAPHYLAPVLRRLRQYFPDIDVQTRIESFEALTKGVLAGQIHLALTYDLGLDASFERRTCIRVAPRAWFADDDPLAAFQDVCLADLAERPLILAEQGLSSQHMLRLFRAKGLLPRISHRAATVEILRSLAANGEGVGISYTSPAGLLSYDGTPLGSARITDPEAEEPIVLAYAGALPAPLPGICTAIAEVVC
ncbi:LysR family transcriptional regulator [Solirhodobacter olei]|uniref:LysR family transcriptional regulator n=1 Tax=Solirhodobacter olei TaxID=2493082 RepID=UPI000FD9846D|nr:LysR family transcriptional regulator [Solirhodobacter olei]